MRILSFLFLSFHTSAVVYADLTVEVVKEAGYPLDIHSISTIDGFKLRLHRIPKGIQKLHYEDESQEIHDKGSVLLVHGLIAGGTQWVVGDKSKALAFMLADAGYDVWIFNARGTTFSRFNKNHGVDTKEYWDFSWHEIGTIDLPTVVDYIHKENGNETIRYVGHSQGGTTALVLLSTMPEYNKKLGSVHLLAPAVFLQNMSSLLLPVVRYTRTLSAIANGMGLYAFVPGNLLSRMILDVLCQNSAQIQEACADVFFSLVGNDTEQMDKNEILKIVPKYITNRASLKQIIHFGQIVSSGQFRHFDYGTNKNQRIYHRSTPPMYDLSQVTAPVTVFYGSKDALVSPQGIQQLLQSLPNLRQSFETPLNHLDMILAKDVDVIINDRIIRSMIAEANDGLN